MMTGRDVRYKQTLATVAVVDDAAVHSLESIVIGTTVFSPSAAFKRFD